jgi:hypothetical protein
MSLTGRRKVAYLEHAFGKDFFLWQGAEVPQNEARD